MTHDQYRKGGKHWKRHVSSARYALINQKIYATEARVVILDAVRSAESPVSAEDLGQILKKQKHTFDETTIYRTLSMGVEKSLLKEVRFGDNFTRYEWDDCHHHYLICTSCRNAAPIHICLPEKTFNEALKEVNHEATKKSTGTSHIEFSAITNHSLELFGLCKKCAA